MVPGVAKELGGQRGIDIMVEHAGRYLSEHVLVLGPEMADVEGHARLQSGWLRRTIHPNELHGG
jgi:hypothetical protein